MLIVDWGIVYRISARAYRRLVEARARGVVIPPYNYGGKVVGQVVADLSDWDQDRATFELDTLRSRKTDADAAGRLAADRRFRIR